MDVKEKRDAVKEKRDSVGSNTSKGIKRTKQVNDPNVHLLGTSLVDLPYDIVANILLELPIKPLLICKCVCKSWHSIISDPHFAELHFEHAPIGVLVRTSNYRRRVSRALHLLDFDEFKSSDNDGGQVCSCKDSPKPNCDNHLKPEVKLKLPLRDSKMVLGTLLEARKRGSKRTYIPINPKDDKFHVMSSCNGLLCLCDPVKIDPIVVCNPITGEFIRLPQSKNHKVMRDRRVFFGFGYLKKTNEYKVLRIYDQYLLHRKGYYFAEIHTLGTRLWRDIGYNGPHYWWGTRSATYCLNGWLHWLVSDDLELSILSFDLECEKFNSFPCPSALSYMRNIPYRIGFGELKGSLYICCPYLNTKCLRFWTMKTYCVGQYSWTEVFSFNTDNFVYWPRLYRPMIGCAGPGILLYDDSPGRYFIYYEPQKHLFRFFEVRGKPLFKLEPIFHRPSLIRLKDTVKGDNIEVVNIHSRCATFKLREDKDVLYLAKYKADLEDMTMEALNFF